MSPVDDIDVEWNFKHFKPWEFICRCNGLCAHEDEMSRVVVAGFDALREDLGIPLHVNCGVRCPEHNHDVGGVIDSKHLDGLAGDISTPPGMTSEKFAEAGEKIPLFANGGIGLYNTFVHFDGRGGKARWDKRS